MAPDLLPLLVMRSFFILALLLASVLARAESLWVPFTWSYSQGGTLHLPPASYLSKLAACGITPRGTEGTIEISRLSCPGLLDFSREKQFQAKLVALLGRLSAAHVQRVGAVDVATLSSQARSIRFALSEHLIFHSFADTVGTPRMTAVNIASEKLVILNGPAWNLFKNSASADLLLLHELLGAAGIDDGGYQATLAMWWMSIHPERIPDLSARLSRLIEVRAPTRLAGTTIVGHGGDPGELQFKASLLDASTRQLSVPGVPTQALPSRTDLEEAIILASISSVSTQKLQSLDVCRDQNGQTSILTCGGFALKGRDGKPFILMAEEWGQTNDPQRQYPLLYKVIADVVRELICNGGKFKCG